MFVIDPKRIPACDLADVWLRPRPGTDAAIASMVKIEPLMNATLEKQRLVYAFKTHFVTPETDEIGVGDIKDERMAKAIKLLAETYGLANVPTVASVFDRSFLPPKDARVLKLNM